MFTTVAENKTDIVYRNSFESIDDAFEACDEMGLSFYAYILDEVGLKLTMEDVINYMFHNKHYVVKVYFKGFSPDYEKCHIWFRASRKYEMFEEVKVPGSDGITYTGIVVGDNKVDKYFPHMGKYVL